MRKQNNSSIPKIPYVSSVTLSLVTLALVASSAVGQKALAPRVEVIPNASQAGEPSGALYDEIAKADSALFDALNAHDAERAGTFFTKDLEFYHDEGGLTSYTQTMDGFRSIIARNDGWRRELVKGSLEVFPVPNYGAIETGSHTFRHTENGQEISGTFKFILLWQKIEGDWKVSRVLSYGHDDHVATNAPAAKQTLYREIKALDDSLFSNFNTRRADRMSPFFAEDVEFYHEQGGLMRSQQRLVESLRSKFESDYRQRGEIVRREVVKGNLEVYPIPNYGAMEIGEHRFYVTGKDNKKVSAVTIGKFAHIWQKKGPKWVITRALSYDHRPDTISDSTHNQ